MMELVTSFSKDSLESVVIAYKPSGPSVIFSWAYWFLVLAEAAVHNETH